MDNKFRKLQLKEELLTNLEELKFDSMTPVQAESLPVVLEGKDVIVQAKTGSGKTAAFGLGILNSLNVASKEIQALVLCPTRELAEQVAGEIRMLARTLSNVRVLTLCGGFSASLQEKGLQTGTHIVVGTPGRVLYHLRKGSLDVDLLKMFTLDEADRMLDMGFHEDIVEVTTYLPRKRQSLLFSATYPENIKKLGEDISGDIKGKPVEIKVDVAHEEDDIKQVFYEVVSGDDKNNFLYKILSKYRPDRAIVFCQTKQETNDVANFLIKRDVSAKSINGDLEQNERTSVLTKFSNRSLSVLVATDVAARGLDIEDLAAVINYKIPSGAEAYIHRIGRTGRAGKKGMVFSFFDPMERNRLDEIESLTFKKSEVEETSKLSYSEKYNLTPPMKTMYISGGKKDKLRRGDILGALIGEANLAAKDIGDISVFDLSSYVAIKSKYIDQAIKKLSLGKIKKRKYKVGLV